jgi:hypothetical protein
MLVFASAFSIKNIEPDQRLALDADVLNYTRRTLWLLDAFFSGWKISRARFVVISKQQSS